MEEQSPLQKLKAKLSQTIERSAVLIAENKHYEFAQKVKMLAQRKQQTNKLTQAQVLLQLGIKKMLSQQEVDYNANNDLVVTLLDIYEGNKNFWEKDKTDELYAILTIKENDRNYEYFLRIMKNLTTPKDAPKMAEYVINFFQKQKLFHKAETLIVKEDLSRVTSFLEKWHDEIDNDEYTIVVCRMALLKGYQEESFDESMVLLSELDTLNPFVKFTKFLILSVQMKSKQSYDKIETSYKKFLKSDEFFAGVFESYGSKFFKKQKGGGIGLLNLFEK